MPSLKGSSNVDGLVTKNDSANDWLKIFKYIDCICLFFNSKIQVIAKETWWCTIGIQPGHLSLDFRTRLEQFLFAHLFFLSICLLVCPFVFSHFPLIIYLFLFIHLYVERHLISENIHGQLHVEHGTPLAWYLPLALKIALSRVST